MTKENVFRQYIQRVDTKCWKYNDQKGRVNKCQTETNFTVTQGDVEE